MSSPTHEGLWLRVSTFGGQIHEYAESVYERGGIFVYDSPEANGAVHVTRAADHVWRGPLAVAGGTPEGWEPVDWIATNVCESIDALLIGHDVFGEAWDDAGMESRRAFLCEVSSFIRKHVRGRA